MKVSIFLLVFTFFATPVFAGEAIFPEPTSSDDLIVIKQPEKLRTYYGTLDGYPHTYSIQSLEAFLLTVQVRIPEDDPTNDNRSIIVVKKVKRGVEEITRLRADEAEWPSVRNRKSGDIYRQGDVYSEILESGEYLVEVSTPDNIGQYAFTVGDIDISPGYFTSVKDMYNVKQFLGKPGLSVLFTKLVYVPLIMFLFIGLVVFGYRKYA